MCTGGRSAWSAERSDGGRASRVAKRVQREPTARGELAGARPPPLAAGEGAEDFVPVRGADAEPRGVVLEVVTHVELTQLLACGGARLGVMQVVVRHVVDEVA